METEGEMMEEQMLFYWMWKRLMDEGRTLYLSPRRYLNLKLQQLMELRKKSWRSNIALSFLSDLRKIRKRVGLLKSQQQFPSTKCRSSESFQYWSFRKSEWTRHCNYWQCDAGLCLWVSVRYWTEGHRVPAQQTENWLLEVNKQTQDQIWYWTLEKPRPIMLKFLRYKDKKTKKLILAEASAHLQNTFFLNWWGWRKQNLFLGGNCPGTKEIMSWLTMTDWWLNH